MSNKSLFRHTRANGTSNIVGSFFEELARSILSAEPCEATHGDLVQWNDPAFVGEVKASDNVHSFRIPKDQFDHQAEQLGFPYSDQLFVLCKYKNKQGRRRGRPRRSIINKLKTEDRIREYLAQSRIRIHILHRSVIEALERHLYPQGKLPLGIDEVSCIEFNHRTLERFCHPTRSKQWLNEIGLKGFKSYSFCLKVPLLSPGFFKVETEVVITTVLPSRFSAKMYDALFAPRLGRHKMAVAA